MFSLQSSSLCKRIVRAVSSAPVSSSSFAPLSSPFFFARQQQRSFSKRVYSQYRVFGPGGTPAEEQIVMAFRIKPPTLKQSTHYSSVQYRGSLDLEFTRKSPATQQFDYNSTVSTRLTMDAYCELMHFFMRSLTHSCSLELSSKDYQLKPCLKYQQTSSESSPDVETLSCSTTQAGEGLGTVNITVVDASGQTANLKMSLAQAYGAHIMLKHAYPHMYAIDETLVPVMAQEANEDDHRW